MSIKINDGVHSRSQQFKDSRSTIIILLLQMSGHKSYDNITTATCYIIMQLSMVVIILGGVNVWPELLTKSRWWWPAAAALCMGYIYPLKMNVFFSYDGDPSRLVEEVLRVTFVPKFPALVQFWPGPQWRWASGLVSLANRAWWASKTRFWEGERGTETGLALVTCAQRVLDRVAPGWVVHTRLCCRESGSRKAMQQ